MSKPLFCILGASASGKTTLVKMLENEFKMKQIPSYTTRSTLYGESNKIKSYINVNDYKNNYKPFMSNQIETELTIMKSYNNELNIQPVTKEEFLHKVKTTTISDLEIISLDTFPNKNN